MENPTSVNDGNISSQILLELGKMSTSLAVIQEQLKGLPDHENRIRNLERWKYSLPITLLLAIGSTAAAIVSLIHK